MTAAATTGPARGPLPASSTPAGAEYPRPRAFASKPSNGTALLLGRFRGIGRALCGPFGRDDDPLLRKPVLLLADARLLPGHLAQVEELRAADVASLLHLDLFEEGRVDRVGTLDADAVRLLADLERGGDGVPVETDHDPLEILDALLLPFLDPREDPDGVPHVDFREILALLPGFDILEETHGHILSFRCLRLRVMKKTCQCIPTAMGLSTFSSAGPGGSAPADAPLPPCATPRRPHGHPTGEPRGRSSRGSRAAACSGAPPGSHAKTSRCGPPPGPPAPPAGTGPPRRSAPAPAAPRRRGRNPRWRALRRPGGPPPAGPPLRTGRRGGSDDPPWPAARRAPASGGSLRE